MLTYKNGSKGTVTQLLSNASGDECDTRVSRQNGFNDRISHMEVGNVQLFLLHNGLQSSLVVARYLELSRKEKPTSPVGGSFVSGIAAS